MFDWPFGHLVNQPRSLLTAWLQNVSLHFICQAAAVSQTVK